MIPEKLSSNIRSGAEIKLFEIFQKQLSDDYIVFHSTWWQHIGYIIQDREADFIIIHPDKGILILEAKGGQIQYDPINKYWYQNEIRMKISPFQQASDIKYRFLKFLNQYNEFSSKDFYIIGQCVAFPDIDDVINGLPSEAPAKILLLRPHLNNISNWISSVFNYYNPQEKLVKLGKDRTEKIINLISPSTTFKKYIVNDIGEIEHEILQLTEQQYNILDNLYFQSQSIILGCAGSGKTQLAIEKTRRLCQHKIKTLVTCKSPYLSLYLKLSLQEEINHGYCLVYNFQEIQENNFKFNDQIKAIILDEGQDFDSLEINQLKQLIQNDDIFYIFQDSNQNIKNTNISVIPLPIYPNVLDKNCRNTHNIFEYSKDFVSCNHPIKSSLIKGKEVIKNKYNNKNDILKILEKDILNLVDNEKVNPNQIIVLTDIYPLSKSILASYSKINRFDLQQYSFSNHNQNTICWSNIGIYKGLESDIVILLLEISKKLIPTKWEITNKYIGATRAKSLLIVNETPDPEINFE